MKPSHKNSQRDNETTTYTHSNYRFAYDENDTTQESLNRLECLKIASATCTQRDPDRVVEFAKRYWRFVSEGD